MVSEWYDYVSAVVPTTHKNSLCQDAARDFFPVPISLVGAAFAVQFCVLHRIPSLVRLLRATGATLPRLKTAGMDHHLPV